MARWRKNEEAQDCNAEGKPSINASKSTAMLEKCPTKDIKREEIINLEVQADEHKPKLDLSLKLSLPDLNLPYEASSVSAPTSIPIINKGKTVNLSKLICMGCQSCYKFVMVPEADQRCPWCHEDKYLIEISCETPAKKRKLI